MFGPTFNRGPCSVRSHDLGTRDTESVCTCLELYCRDPGSWMGVLNFPGLVCENLINRSLKPFEATLWGPDIQRPPERFYCEKVFFVRKCSGGHSVCCPL